MATMSLKIPMLLVFVGHVCKNRNFFKSERGKSRVYLKTVKYRWLPISCWYRYPNTENRFCFIFASLFFRTLDFIFGLAKVFHSCFVYNCFNTYFTGSDVFFLLLIPLSSRDIDGAWHFCNTQKKHSHEHWLLWLPP